MTFVLDKLEALRAVDRAIVPYSAYIRDEINRSHALHVKRGGVGHPPTSARILRHLRALARDGLLTTDGVTSGFYGFRWSLTAAGRTALANGAFTGSGV